MSADGLPFGTQGYGRVCTEALAGKAVFLIIGRRRETVEILSFCPSSLTTGWLTKTLMKTLICVVALRKYEGKVGPLWGLE